MKPAMASSCKASCESASSRLVRLPAAWRSLISCTAWFIAQRSMSPSSACSSAIDIQRSESTGSPSLPCMLRNISYISLPSPCSAITGW